MGNITISAATPHHIDDIHNVSYVTWMATYPNPELGITQDHLHQVISKDLSPEERFTFTDGVAIPQQKMVLVVST